MTPDELNLIEKLAAPEVTREELQSRRKAETDLLTAFKANPTKDTFTPLYQSFKPWIYRAAQRNMYGSPIPQAAHQAYAAQSFLDATRTWDPAKGEFRTHAFNTVFEKGKRLNLQYQNIGYIPESRATQYQNYQTSLHLLREELGREPSTLELSDEMRVAPIEVERLRKEIRKDLILNEGLSSLNKGPAFAQSDKTMQIARDMQYSLIPSHQLVLEHTLGLNGRPSLTKASSGTADVQAISKATKLTVPIVRSALKTISRKMKEYRGELGTHAEEQMFDEGIE